MGERFENSLQIVKALNPLLESTHSFLFGNFAIALRSRLVNSRLPSDIDVLCPISTHHVFLDQVVRNILNYQHESHDEDYTQVILDAKGAKPISLHLHGFSNNGGSIDLRRGPPLYIQQPFIERIKYSGMEVPVATPSLLILLGRRPRVVQ